MPRVKAKEIREFPEDELLSRIESHKEELFNLRFQFATGQLDNAMRIKQVRHEIAQILTILRERQSEQDLEQTLARADEQALAESRAAQARGEKKGTSLATAAYEARVDEEEGAVGMETLSPEKDEL